MPKRSVRTIAHANPDRFSSPIAKIQTRNTLQGGNKQGPQGTRPFKDGEQDFNADTKPRGRR